jgi:hypothetical protein
LPAKRLLRTQRCRIGRYSGLRRLDVKLRAGANTRALTRGDITDGTDGVETCPDLHDTGDSPKLSEGCEPELSLAETLRCSSTTRQPCSRALSSYVLCRLQIDPDAELCPHDTASERVTGACACQPLAHTMRTEQRMLEEGDEDGES